jgi:hypothetical protein
MGYVDGWTNMPSRAGEKFAPVTDNVVRWYHKQSDQLREGGTIDELVAMMDSASIEKGLLTARHTWSHSATRPIGPFSASHGMPDDIFNSFCEEAAAAIEKYKGRFYGAVLIDPNGAMTAVRQLERAVKEYGFVACRLFPASAGIPADDPLYYLIYAKCVELGIPVTVNIGLPGPMRRGRLQDPMLLDEILLTFPELKVIGAHGGHPWILQTVALMQKHPNFYLMTSGWAPKYISDDILHFMNTRGANQVMWATGYPLVSMERSAREAEELPLRDDVKQRYMRDNCIEVFGLG